MKDATIVRLVARREIRERAFKRSYVISTLVTLLVVVAIVVVPQLLGGGPTELRIGLLGDEPAATRQALTATAETLGVDELTLEEVVGRSAAADALEAGELDGVVENGARLLVDDDADDTLQQVVTTALQQRQVLDRLAASGVSAADAGAVLAPEPVEVVPLGGQTAEEVSVGQGIAFAGIILLFIMVTSNAGLILTGTVEEKSSRVVEVLLGTVRPWHLLAGKLLGLGTMALAQFLLIVAAGLGAVVATGAFEMPDATVGAVALSVLWFLLGFAFFAALYAVAGALASSMEDAQSTAAPLGLGLTAGYLLTLLVVAPNPESVWSRVLSQLPPLAPMAIPARAAQSAILWWEIVVAVVIMVAAIYGTIRLGGRLYAEAILRTGGRVKLREVWGAEEVSAAG